MANTDRATLDIEYCLECSFTLLAIRAAQELLLEFEDRLKYVKLIPGADNTFEVAVNNSLVFSRLKLGRHPEAGELVGKVGDALRRH